MRENIVNKIALKSLKANKVRSIMSIISIIVILVLIEIALNLEVSIVVSSEQQVANKFGNMAQYKINNPTYNQIDKLHNLKYIESIGQEIFIGEGKCGEIGFKLESVDEEEWTKHRKGTLLQFKGQFPKNKNEIILSENLIKELGIQKPYIGKSIQPKCYVQNNSKNNLEDYTEINFKIVGWFNDQRLYDVKKQGIVYVSNALEDEYGKTVTDNGVVYLSVKENPLIKDFKIITKALNIPVFSDRSSNHMDMLRKDIGLSNPQEVEQVYVWPTYIYNAFDDLKVYLILVLPTIICAFLLIYDCFFMSVVKDIKQSGLLMAVGASPKQMKAIINKQAEILFIIGSFSGILLSIILSVYIVPMYLKINELHSNTIYNGWSLSAYILSLIITFIIVMISAHIVSYYTGRIGIIQSIRYEKIGKRSNYLKWIFKKLNIQKKQPNIQGNLYKMGIENGIRNIKNNKHVLISLFLATIVFMFVNVVVGGTTPEDFAIYRLQNHDFVLTNETFSSEYIELDQLKDGMPEKSIFSEEFISELRNQEGVRDINIIAYLPVAVKMDLDVIGKYVSNHFDNHGGRVEIKQDTYEQGALWIIEKKYLLSKLNKEQKENINLNSFENGQQVLLESDRPDLFPQNVFIQGYFIGDDKKYDKEMISLNAPQFRFKIGGFFPPRRNEKDIALTSVPPCIYASSGVIKDVKIKPIIFEIDIDTDQEHQITIESFIKHKTENNPLVWVESREQLISTMKASQETAYILGYMICIIIALIGILGLLNLTILNIELRKGEMAVLRSIGMSRKQLYKMLITEGLFYAVILISLIVTIGSLIIYNLYPFFKSEYETFNYPTTTLVLSSCIIVCLLIIIPIAMYLPEIYKSISKTLQEIN